jgi:uncharacterized protein (DUF2249 family)
LISIKDPPKLSGDITTMQNAIVTVDVREDIRLGREPFQKIMSAASDLTSNQDLLLLAPFEPVPLLRIMSKRGFGHRASTLPSGDWEILFTRENDVTATAAEVRETGVQRPAAEAVVELDLRGLEPPQPLIRIMEAVTTLPPCGVLEARTDRRPIHLYPELEARGFSGQTEPEKDGSYLTRITRA